MKIYLDAMGGDHAPQAPVEGAKEALQNYPDLSVILSGPIETVRAEVDRVFVGEDALRSRIELCDCPELISLEEAPMMAVRKKKQSAITDGMLKLREGMVDAFVSAGSTGAVLAGGILRLGRLRGIDRPAIAAMLPNGKGYVLLLDSGANVDCQPNFLHQFAYMGKAYAQGVMGLKNPKIGLINNGAEEEKGCQLTKEVYQRLKTDGNLNFVGNIEARYILSGDADVLVCDGFVGNTVLKFMEGCAVTLLGMIKENLMSSFISKIGALLCKGAFKSLKKTMDYNEIGGAPLLGVNGVVIKAHGSSKGHAIACAIRQAVNMVDGKVVPMLKEQLSQKGEPAGEN